MAFKLLFVTFLGPSHLPELLFEKIFGHLNQIKLIWKIASGQKIQMIDSLNIKKSLLGSPKNLPTEIAN